MRILRLTRRFQLECRVLVPRGTPEWEALAQILRELGDDRVPLPAREDCAVKGWPFVMSRAVPEARVSVCYVPGFEIVSILALLPLAPEA